MTIADEEEFVGVESHLVQSVDPGEKCNGKRTVTIHGQRYSESIGNIDPEVLDAIKEHNDIGDLKGRQENRTFFVGYCKNPAGKATDHVGEGRCGYHGGDGSGAPAHNQNAQQSSMTVDPHHYHENLPQDEKEWIRRTTSEILDRVRRLHDREPDFLDRTLARLITIELHIAYKATDYSKDELVQVIIHDNDSHEEKGALVEEVRRYTDSIIQNLTKLGVMDDPESQKADAVENWREFVDDGEDDTAVIEVENTEESD